MTSTQAWREILVAVAGLTPQVITETLYYLTQRRDPPVAIAEIHILTTQPGRQRICSDLLTPDRGRFYTFCAEYDVDPTSIAFDDAHIHVLTDATGVPLEDIRTAAESAAVADHRMGVGPLGASGRPTRGTGEPPASSRKKRGARGRAPPVAGGPPHALVDGQRRGAPGGRRWRNACVPPSRTRRLHGLPAASLCPRAAAS